METLFEAIKDIDAFAQTITGRLFCAIGATRDFARKLVKKDPERSEVLSKKMEAGDSSWVLHVLCDGPPKTGLAKFWSANSDDAEKRFAESVDSIECMTSDSGKAIITYSGGNGEPVTLIGAKLLRWVAIAVVGRFTSEVSFQGYSAAMTVLMEALRKEGWSLKEVMAFILAVTIVRGGEIDLAINKVAMDFAWVSVPFSIEDIFDTRTAKVLRACLKEMSRN